MQEIEERYINIFDNLYDGAYFVDRDRKITYWNQAAEKITGFSPQEVVGKDCASNIFTHIDKQVNNLCKGLCPLAESMNMGETKEAELYLHHKKGHRIPVSVRIIPFKDNDGNVNKS